MTTPIVFTQIQKEVILRENKNIISFINKKSDVKYTTNKQWPPWPAWKSAYEMYVDNWWTLSEQEWIDSFSNYYTKTEIWNNERNFSTDFENIFLT